MQLPGRIRFSHTLAALLLAGSATLVCGQDHETTQNSLLAGLPSSVPLHHGQAAASRAIRIYNKTNEPARLQREESIAETRKNQRVQVASARYGQRTFHRAGGRRTLPPKRGSRKPVVETVPDTEVVKTNYQDTTLSFVDPRQQAIAGLRVIATIHRKTPRPGQQEEVVVGDKPNAPLITDPEGRVRLRKIGPLPVSIDIAFAEDKEWRHTNAQAASLFIPSDGIGPSREMNGRAVAVYSGSPDTAPARRAEMARSRREICADPHAPVTAYASPAAPPKAAVRREFKDVIYNNSNPTLIAVEHTVVDVQVTTQPGCALTTPAAPGQAWMADAGGIAVCKIPVAALGSGPIPIRVSKDLPGGEAEALITGYKTDPYDRDNTVKCDSLRLVRLREVDLPGGASVLDEAGRIENAMGSEKKEARNATGGVMWQYPGGAVAWMRPMPNPDAEMLCEELVLMRPENGKVGGIQVGSTLDQVHEAMGAPTAHSVLADGLARESYLDGGLFVFCKDNRVQQISVARPTALLKEGTTAFVRRPKARLYVESFLGDERVGLADKKALRGYLSQVHSIELVDTPENADLTLAAQARFHDAKDKLVGTLPLKYDCDVNLDYTIQDTEKGRNVGGTGQRAEASADYQNEVTDDAQLMKALLSHEDARKILEAVDKTASPEEQDRLKRMSKDERAQMRVQHLLDLQNSMHNAARRCPILASRKAFGGMVADITRAADFNVRVTGINYTTGQINLNVGTADGVQVSTEQAPYQFEISVMGEALPYHEQGLSADYYTAVVTEAEEHSCACQLRHRWRTVEQGAESEQEQAAIEAAQHIPNPHTGVVSARAWLPNPQLDASLIVPEDPEYNEFIRYVFGPEPGRNKEYAGFQRIYNHLIVLPVYGPARYTRAVIFAPPSPTRIEASRPVVIQTRPGVRASRPLPLGWQYAVKKTNPAQSGVLVMPAGKRAAEIHEQVTRQRQQGLATRVTKVTPPVYGGAASRHETGTTTTSRSRNETKPKPDSRASKSDSKPSRSDSRPKADTGGKKSDSSSGKSNSSSSKSDSSSGKGKK